MEYYPKKSIWKWILLYIIIGAVAYGAVYYFFFMKNGGYGGNSQTQNKVQQNNSAQSAGWETYTNTEYGFELQYPASWKLPKDYGNMVGFDAFSINIDPNVKKVSSKDFVLNLLKSDMGFDMKYTTQKELTIGGTPAYELYMVPCEPNACEVIFLARGSNMLRFEFPIANPAVADEVNNNNIVHQILSTFRFTNITNANENNLPKIDSINPLSGPKGVVVEIRGSGLSGFEGDLDVYFERSDGKRVMLIDNYGDYAKTQDRLIKVKVVEPCQKGEKVMGRYSGIESECDYVELTPGTYKVYTEPWGKKSNVVNFELTK